jgi:hypothetical protein
MRVKSMKAVSASLMGNGRTSENTVAHMWAMTAEICDRIERGAGAGFRDYEVDPRNLREVVERRSDMLAEHQHKSFWERFKAWFAWRNG